MASAVPSSVGHSAATQPTKPAAALAYKNRPFALPPPLTFFVRCDFFVRKRTLGRKPTPDLRRGVGADINSLL
jgi:hypothetical protein